MTDTAPSFPTLLQRFFVDHLRQQRAVSPCTVAAYRDTFKLLLAFAEKRIGKSPTDVTLPDLNADLILAFLDHLERERANSVRSRNARLSAIRVFLKYAAHEDLTALAVIERSLAVPQKRHDKPVLGYLTRPEVHAIINAPDPKTWAGRREPSAVRVPLQHRRTRVRGHQPSGRQCHSGDCTGRSPAWEGTEAPKRAALE